MYVSEILQQNCLKINILPFEIKTLRLVAHIANPRLKEILLMNTTDSS